MGRAWRARKIVFVCFLTTTLRKLALELTWTLLIAFVWVWAGGRGEFSPKQSCDCEADFQTSERINTNSPMHYFLSEVLAKKWSEIRVLCAWNLSNACGSVKLRIITICFNKQNKYIWIIQRNQTVGSKGF